MCVLLITRLLRLVGRLGTRKPVFNHTSWMTVVTPTARPKSVRNRCVIEVFGGVCVMSIGFRIFCWYRGFGHRTESDLLLVLYWYLEYEPFQFGYELFWVRIVLCTRSLSSIKRYSEMQQFLAPYFIQCYSVVGVLVLVGSRHFSSGLLKDRL